MIELCLDQAFQIYGIYNLFLRHAAEIETHLVQVSQIYDFNGHIFKGILVDEFCLNRMYYWDHDASSQIYCFNSDFPIQPQSNPINPINPTQPQSTLLNPTQPQLTPVNPTQFLSTQLNPTQSHLTPLNPTQPKSTPFNPTHPH